MEIQIVGKSAILIYVFYKISNSNPNTNFWFSIISQSKSQLISEIFWFPIPTYFPTFSVDLFPNSKLSWEKIIDRSEVEDTKNYFLSCFDLRVWTKNWNKWCCLTFFWVYEFFLSIYLTRLNSNLWIIGRKNTNPKSNPKYFVEIIRNLILWPQHMDDKLPYSKVLVLVMSGYRWNSMLSRADWLNLASGWWNPTKSKVFPIIHSIGG